MTVEAVAPVGCTASGHDRDSVQRLVAEHIAPRAGSFEASGSIPEDVLARVSAARLWAPFLPRRLGGDDLAWADLGPVHEEVGRGCSSVRSLLTVQTMVAWAIWRWGSELQQRRWCPELASGAALGSFCLSEPGAGSETSDIAATATRCDDGWALHGVKRWITGGQRADVLLVFARVEGSIAAFIVPTDAPGVSRAPITDVMGTRGSMLAEITLDDVQVGPDAQLGPTGFVGGMLLTGALDLGRYSVACGSVGIVQASLDASAAYTAARIVGGSPLSERQLVRAKVSDMVTDVHAARLLCERAGRLKDADSPDTIMATWVAKYFASTAAARHASAAVQVHGAAGCSESHPVARLLRDAQVMEIIEGSNEIQQLTIADEAYRGVRDE